MPSLKETKGRITSVKSTLKITSAMKMVASAKLHKAQNAIESMLPYQQQLQSMLLRLLISTDGVDRRFVEENPESDSVALVVFSSNSSLCGGFNSNIIREVKCRIQELKNEGIQNITVFSVGNKVSEAMSKFGYPSPADYSDMLNHPSFQSSAELAASLTGSYLEGNYRRVELIFTHFVSTATQRVTRSSFLPMSLPLPVYDNSATPEDNDLIVEPDNAQVLNSLLPRVLNLSIYTTVLDTTAAEHAARTIAMQVATDNGNIILAALVLEYNKARQQKITSEILDLVGGSFQ